MDGMQKIKDKQTLILSRYVASDVHVSVKFMLSGLPLW